LVGVNFVPATPLHDGHLVEDSIALGRFGSAHPDSWNASFCDGSVRSMPYDIDWRIHRDLGNRGDGNQLDFCP
jgi:prepilin-type processing-associated H-X9-DG protein